MLTDKQRIKSIRRSYHKYLSDSEREDRRNKLTQINTHILTKDIPLTVLNSIISTLERY